MHETSHATLELFGYSKSSRAINPSQLKEVTFCGSPEVLRCVAEFLQRAATAMERHGAEFGHMHFEDEMKYSVGPQIIVGGLT
jgi:hypothetical protein